MTTIPRDVPPDMTPFFLEGVTKGKLGQRDDVYEIEIIRAQEDKDDYAAAEAERKDQYFKRGYCEGEIHRLRLKGGV
jgi:hypothetical protein